MLIVSSVIAGGVLGAVLRAWSLSTRIHSLEVAVGALQGQVTRYVKTVAALERWGGKSRAVAEAQELLEAKKDQMPLVTEPKAWWKTG